MKIFKAPRFSLLYKTFMKADRIDLIVSVLSFVPFSNPKEPMQESEAIPKAQEILGSQPLCNGDPKPRGEWLAFGSGFSPTGDPVQELLTSISVDGARKALRLTGEREWIAPKNSSIRISDASPFKAMRIDPSQAFGGPEFKDNPIGKGFWPAKNIPDQFPLPCVTYPDSVIGRPEDIVPPAFYCGRDPMLPERQQFYGTYDQAWAEAYFPAWPNDFNEEYFLTAPVDQQQEKYFTGSETFSMENMHPQQPRQTVTLPGIRARGFLTINRQQGEERFEEIEFKTDTVVLLPEIELAVVINRGSIPVESMDFHEAVSLITAFEWQSDAPRDSDYYKQVRDERSDFETAAESYLKFSDLYPLNWVEPKDPMIDIIKPRDPTVDIHGRPQIDVVWGKWKARLDEGLDKIGETDYETFAEKAAEIAEDPDVTAVKAELRGLQAKTSQEIKPADILSTANSERAFSMVKNYVDAQVDAGENLLKKHCAFFGHDYNELKANALRTAPKTPQEILKLVNSELTRIANDGNSPQAVKEAAQRAMPLSEYGFSEADEAFAELEAGARAEMGSGTPEVDRINPAENEDVREEVTGALTRKESLVRGSFAGADLSGIDFSGAKLYQADFTSCDLSGASFVGADCEEACFAHANLTDAWFDGGNLIKTNFGKTILDNTTFNQASLDEANFSEAIGKSTSFAFGLLPDTQFKDMILDSPSFIGCTLTTAQFFDCSLKQADFSTAKINQSSFFNCDLSSSKFHKTEAEKTLFVGVDARECDFRVSTFKETSAHEKSNFHKSDFRESDLRASNFRGGIFTFANFTNASLSNCDFSETELYGAIFAAATGSETRFMRAVIDHVDLRGADFRSSSFTLSKFINSDARGVNFFEADFVKAHIKDVEFGDANIGRTILEGFRF